MGEKKFLDLLQKKRGFFEALLDLSEEESTLPTQEWISVLEQKKILLSCVEEIDQELNNFRAAFHQLSHEMHEELDHMRILVKKILFLDSQNQQARRHLFQRSDDTA